MLTGTFALKLCKIKIPMQVIFTKLIIYFFVIPVLHLIMFQFHILLLST